MKITGGHGADVVYDPVGRSSFFRLYLCELANCLVLGMLLPSLKCVAWNARLVVVGFAAGNIEKVRLCVARSLETDSQ